MTCRHPASARQTLNHADWDCLYDCNICRACGEWLSCGRAKRADPDELILAELLSDLWLLWGAYRGTAYERAARAEREADTIAIMAGSGPKLEAT